MIAIINGDIIQSASLNTDTWLPQLKMALNVWGKNPKNWEIYRGDSFQLEIKEPQQALWAAFKLKAMIKTIPDADVRMSIGIGSKDHTSDRITESNGSAFVNAGRKFDMLKKEKVNMAIMSENESFNTEMNLFIRFALNFMDEWTRQAAILVNTIMENMDKTQSELAAILNINQSAVSQGKKRANFDLIADLNDYYIKRVNEIFG